jgi:hypothetical protein
MSGFLEIPGRCWHNYAGWGPVGVEILTAEDPEQLTAQATMLLDNAECNVLAISAASMTATYCAEPWTMTVVLQIKVDPLMNGASS